MEFIIGALVILVLLIILGVSAELIIQGILWILEILLLMMTLFFIVSVVFLLLGKRCNAEFLRIDMQGKWGNAVYCIDGAEYRNTYPAELLLQKWIYRKRMTTAKLWQRGEISFLFDWYSIIIVALGLPLSAAGAVLLGSFLLWL